MTPTKGSRDHYAPQLKRTLGGFQVFAISFAFISVAVGVFGTYDDVLQNAGPVGIWLWVLVFIGQILISLVIAQFAGRIALSGSSYQWASRLANPIIGWGFGWLSFCFLVISVMAVNSAMVSTAIMPLFGMTPDEQVARVLTVAALTVQAILAISSTRIVAMINSCAVGLELILVLVLSIALVISMMVTGNGSIGNLVSQGVAEGNSNYFAIGGGLMLAMIMGLATLTGFEAAANLGEEAKDPFRTIPRAIVGSVAAAGVLGLIFLVALTVSINDIPKVSASSSPVTLIMREMLGSVIERALLIGIILAFFAAGLATMTACSRIVFAMSRDSRFPAHKLMRKINPHTQTPVLATMLIFAVGVILMVALPGTARMELITASTILPAIIYGSLIILYLSVRKQLERKKGAFDLGRFELPVTIGALAWSITVLFVLVTPATSRVPVLIDLGLLVIGGVYFGYLLLFRREVLQTEPDAGSLGSGH